MNRLPFVAAASFVLLAACSASPESEGASSAAAISAPSPVAQPVDGSYKGSCSNKYGAVDLTVEIANGAVSKITGSLEGRDGKLRVGVPVTDWTAPFTATAHAINASTAGATILGAGAIAYANETRVLQADEETILQTGTCTTSLSFSSLEIVPHNGANNLFRSVVVHGVAANGASCDIANGPLDDKNDWEIECAEDEGAVSSSGLDVLTAVLRGAKPTP